MAKCRINWNKFKKKTIANCADFKNLKYNGSTVFCKLIKAYTICSKENVNMVYF